MQFWSCCVCCFIFLQSVSAQYFFWTLCHLQYGGECRGLCHDGEVNLGLPYCSTPDDDVIGFQGTCCVALPCWYLGGICRGHCIPLYETKYELTTTCPDFRSTCCMPSRDLLSRSQLTTSNTVTTITPSATVETTTTSSVTTATTEAFTATTALPDRIGTCGLPKTSGVPPSVQPSRSDPCAFPWMVSLRTGYSQHYCSGVLVSDHTVLTVASCVEGIEASQLVLTLGDDDVSVEEVTDVVVNVSTITRHPLHRTNRRGNDLALLKIKNTVNSTCVAKVCLPGTHTSPANLGYGRCLLAGWGEGQDSAGGLHVQPVRVYETPACSRLLSALHTNDTLPEDVFCTLQEDNGADGDCKVDGGSILMCPDLNERYFLFGVVTEFTCNNPAMALYTDISYHSAWINHYSQRVR